jgi:hypothetical protein
MKATRKSVLCGLVVVGSTTLWLFAQPALKPPNRDALVMRVNRVQVLAFNTDKPVQEARLIINGKQVGSEAWQADATGFKLAVITSPSRIGRRGTEQEVQVHVEVSNMGSYMTGPYREIREDNLARSEHFGPGTNVVLNGWTEVYSLAHAIGTNVLYDLRVEIR